MIINRYHKTLSLSLACLLVLGMLFSSLPMEIYAADSKMQTGLPEIKSGHNNTLANTSVIAFGGKQWAVIGYNGSGAASAINTVTLLLADGQSFGTCQFSSASNQYNGSTLQTTINGSGVLGSIPAKEQSLIVERTLTSTDGLAGPDAVNQKLWPLSYDEAYLVGTMGWLPDNVLYYQTNQYWLRSPGTSAGMAAVLNSSANGYYIDGEGFAVTSTFYIRPALTLNLADVLFTSAATDGKSSIVGSFLSIAKPITGAVKLTVKDNDTDNLSLDATASLSKTVAQPGETVDVTFSGAKTGPGKYVSCVLTADSGQVLHYGKLSTAANGIASFTLPPLENGSYTIQLFNEQIGGGNNTDFCSVPVVLPLTVYTPPSELKTGGNLSGTDVYFGEYNNAPIHWNVVAKDAATATLWATNAGIANRIYHVGGHANWSGSDVCMWLNGTGTYTDSGFSPQAFAAAEQAAIPAYGTTEIANSCLYLGSPINNLTIDISQKVVLPSIAEIGDSLGAGTWYVEQSARALGSYWWLRSPGFDGYAANVSSTGNVYPGGQLVYFVEYAIRPAVKLDLASVFLLSAAVGGKASTLGALTDLSVLSGAVKLTLPDSDENNVYLDPDARLSETTLQPGDDVNVSFSGAKTGSGKYVSCVITESDDTVLYYGKLSQAASGTASFTVPTLADGIYKVKLFNEQCNEDYYTDYCSAPVEVLMGVNVTVPALSDGYVTRTSDTAATIEFTSSVEGTAYYHVVNRGEAAPDKASVADSGISLGIVSGTVTNKAVTLTAGAKDIYVVVENADGIVSDPLRIEAAAYVAPTYTISVDPTAITFTGAAVGYDNTTMAQTVTITSTGSATVTGMQTSLAGSDFEICETLPSSNLSPGDSATLSVRPIAGLAVGTHADTLSITGNDGISQSVTLSFTVSTAIPVSFAIHASAGTGGSIDPSGAVSANEGDSRTFTITPDANYAITGVTVDGIDQGAISSYTFANITAEHTIHATFHLVNDDDPAYIQRTLTDSATGITVSGRIREDALLSVNDMTLGNDAACEAIRQRMNDSDSIFLLGKDISLSQGFIGALTISIPVGAQYNGQTATILHCADGTLETYTAVVQDGKAAFTVQTGLSPFAVFVESDAEDIPDTGESSSAGYTWILCCIAFTGIGFLILRMTSGKRRKAYRQ